MTVSKEARVWLDGLAQDLAIITPQMKLHQAKDSVADLVVLIRLDPLLSLQIFGHGYAVSPNKDAFLSLSDAINQIGIDALLVWTSELPRLDPHSSSTRLLMTTIGDSMVTAALLAHWHKARQIEWKEADHWACLFSQTIRWMVAYKDPMLVEGIEFRINQGEQIESVYAQVFGFGYNACSEAIAERFQVPTIALLDAVAKVRSNQSATFKYQALAYYLPIATQLATVSRQEWGSIRFQKLIARAIGASLIDGFNSYLPQWLAQIARDYPVPACSAAILAAFQYAGTIDQSLVGDRTQPNRPTELPPLASTASVVATKATHERAPVVENARATAVSPQVAADGPVDPFGAFAPKQPMARGDSSQVERLQQQFTTQQAIFTNEEVAYNRLLKVLIDGMGCSRVLVALYQERIKQVRVQYRESGPGQKNVPHLSFLLPASGIIAYLATKSESFWMTPKRAEDTWKQLPSKMRQVVECDDFFIHSVHIRGKFRALIYVDAFEQETLLTEPEYRQFRALITQFEQLLNTLS